MIGYKLASELDYQYHKKIKITIELLDNISDEKITNIRYHNSNSYYYKQLISNNNILQKRYSEFCEMISMLNNLYNTTVEIKTYYDIQRDKGMRKAIFDVLKNSDYFSKVFDPKNQKLHIRIPCPKCGLIEKNCASTKVEKYSKNEFCINSFCPVHGTFHSVFSIHNHEYVDINIPLRQFCKGLSLLDNDEANNSLSIQVLGNDWSGSWPIRMLFEGIIHLKRLQLPTILFSPLIIKNGIKISKSNTLVNKSQNRILNINKLTTKQINIIWHEIGHWFKDSTLFFDNYDSKYFEGMLN